MNALERKVGTCRVCTERKWLHWRGKLEPTECVLYGNECTGEESWNLPSMYWKEVTALGRKVGTYRVCTEGTECIGEESWNLSIMYWKEMNDAKIGRKVWRISCCCPFKERPRKYEKKKHIFWQCQHRTKYCWSQLCQKGRSWKYFALVLCTSRGRKI